MTDADPDGGPAESPSDDPGAGADADDAGPTADDAEAATDDGRVQREKSYRGISERLAINYLTNLGGERVDDAAVEGEDWRADLSSEKVGIGPSVNLTEVTVAFEGSPERLDDLIERFSQKAMRAGG